MQYGILITDNKSIFIYVNEYKDIASAFLQNLLECRSYFFVCHPSPSPFLVLAVVSLSIPPAAAVPTRCGCQCVYLSPYRPAVSPLWSVPPVWSGLYSDRWCDGHSLRSVWSSKSGTITPRCYICCFLNSASQFNGFFND